MHIIKNFPHKKDATIILENNLFDNFDYEG